MTSQDTDHDPRAVRPSACRRITAPDGTAWTLKVRRLSGGRIGWSVSVLDGDAMVSMFLLEREETTTWGKSATPVALWRVDADAVNPRVPGMPQPIPTVLAVLALISHDADGRPRPHSLARLPYQRGLGSATGYVAAHAIEAMDGSGLPFGVTCGGGAWSVVLPAMPGADLGEIAAALMGGAPIEASLALPSAAELMERLQTTPDRSQPVTRYDGGYPEGRRWAAHMLQWVATRGGVGYAEVEAWRHLAATRPTERPYLPDAEAVLLNTTAPPDTDPVPYLKRLWAGTDVHCVLWWMRRQPAPVWHRALTWAVTRDDRDDPISGNSLLEDLLEGAAECGVIPTLPADLLAVAMHRGSAALRTKLLTALGGKSMAGESQPPFPTHGGRGRR